LLCNSPEKYRVHEYHRRSGATEVHRDVDGALVPSTITIPPELPLNLNGKIDRPALAKMP
jgi:hypothetical protein